MFYAAIVVRNPQHLKILDCLSLYGGSSLPPACRNLQLKILYFVKPLWRTVVASSGSKSSKNKDLGCFKPLWRAWGRTVLKKLTSFLNKPLVPGSFAARGRTCSQNMTFFEEATCPRQLRCLGQNFFLKMTVFLNKPLVPGSFAAWDRTCS